MEISKYTDVVLVTLSEHGLRFLAALAIFFIGRWVAKKIVVISVKMMTKAEMEITLVEFLQKVVYFGLVIVVVLTALNTAGVNTTSFLAVFGAASLAIGLALKDSLSNIGAAILIIFFRPFKIGDFVESAGASGTVSGINLFSTTILTGDNKSIIIPNSSIIAGNTVNYSTNPTRRVDLAFVLDHKNDIKSIKLLLLELAQNDERILKEPAPFVAVDKLSEAGVSFVFRIWVKTEHYWDVHFDMLESAKEVFEKHGVMLPQPIGHVVR